MDSSQKVTMALSYLRSAIKDFESLSISPAHYSSLIYAINNIYNFRSAANLPGSPLHVFFKRECYNK